jgi:hypothetical protein
MAIFSIAPGDIIELGSGVYSGRENCDLILAVDNVTIQGLKGQTTILCDGGENHLSLNPIVKKYCICACKRMSTRASQSGEGGAGKGRSPSEVQILS